MKSLRLCAMLLTVCAVASTATAHPADFTVDFDGVGIGSALYEEHFDLEPFKGWVTVNVTNTSNVAWVNFHFFLFSVAGSDISNVDFMEGVIETVNYDPTSSQSGLTWDIDNVMVGAKVDLFYYGDPILPGNSGQFKVFTNNPDHVAFGVAFYPSPVPEPATMGLLGLGLAGLVARKRRKA